MRELICWTVVMVTCFPVNLNAQEVPGHEQLRNAIVQGKPGIVMKVVRDRSLKEWQYMNRNHPLHLAVRHNQPEVIRVLLEAGARRDVMNGDLETPLMLAVRQKRFECAEVFYETAEQDQFETLMYILDGNVREDSIHQYKRFLAMVPEGREVEPYELGHFFQAASSGSLHILKMFLEQGRSLTERDPTSGWTALHHLAGQGLDEVISRLAEEAIDLTVEDGMGQRALAVAAATRHPTTVKLLLDFGADPNDADFYGNTALHHAARWGDTSMAQALLANGADPSLRNRDGVSPLDIAQPGGEFAAMLPVDSHVQAEGAFGVMAVQCRDAIEARQAGKLMRLLASTNASLDETDRRGFALLHYAIQSSSLEMVRALLEAGAEVNVKDATSGWTPLMMASGGGELEIAKVLLMNGADVDVKEFRGYTALHLAFINGDEKMIAALRLAQPDESLANFQGEVAADVLGHRDVLIERGREREKGSV